MLPKNINKHLNDMKFYIFEQAVYHKIETTIEQCINKLNNIQNDDEKILKYRYGLEGSGLSSQDFIIELYFKNWSFKPTPWGGSSFDPQLKIDTSALNGFSFCTEAILEQQQEKQRKIIIQYFGDNELILYKKMLKLLFEIRSKCGKDYEWVKERSFYKNKWVNV